MEIQWFGRWHNAPIYKDTQQADTPVGRPCLHCEEPIEAGDDGFLAGAIGLDDNPSVQDGRAAHHRACFLRGIFGSIAHQRQECICFKPDGPEDVIPNNLTRRLEAELALAYHEGRVPVKLD